MKPPISKDEVGMYVAKSTLTVIGEAAARNVGAAGVAVGRADARLTAIDRHRVCYICDEKVARLLRGKDLAVDGSGGR